MAPASSSAQPPLSPIQLPFMLVLLLLLVSSGVSRHFKKRILYWKKDRSLDTETPYEVTTSIPEAQQTSNQIFGRVERTGTVYIPIHSKNVVLNCLTDKLLMQKITDPSYQWTGPLGRITKESHKFVLTSDGSLDIHNVEANDSGHYTCKVSYIYDAEQLTSEIHFMVYVYHMPGKSIHLSYEFTVGTCETNTVASFEKYLSTKLESLISNLGCELKQWSTQCHISTNALERITHKLTFQFVVYPLVLSIADLCRGSQCENSTVSIKKAYAKIKEFFEDQKNSSSHSSDLSYAPGTLTGIKVDHCKPGFGKNANNLNNNTMCPGCCVSCPPGRFNAKSSTICTLCPAGSYNDKYGQVECENCPKAKSSDKKGAKTELECHRILPTWMVFSISSPATCLVLVVTWVILTKCCKKTMAAQGINGAESGLKRRLKRFANIASDDKIKGQRSKLSPIKVQQSKVDFLEEESMGLLSNDEVTKTSTPAAASLSPDQTGPSDLENSFEDQASPTWAKENSVAPKDLQSNQQRLAEMMKQNLF